MYCPRSKSAQFFTAFCIGSLVLALPFSVALMRFAKEDLLPDFQEVYYPQSTDAINLLVAGRTVSGERPCCFVLCRIDPARGEVLISVLPPETMVEDAGRFDTAATVWQKEGEQRGAAAIADALNVPVDRWLDLTGDGLRRFGAVVGAIDFVLGESLVLPDQTIAIAEGRQLLDGQKLALLIAYGGENEEERLQLIEELLVAGFSQRLPMMHENQLLAAFEGAVNVGRSNLTVGDFESRRRALRHMTQRPLEVRAVEVAGEYNASRNTFLPSAQSLSELATAFSPPIDSGLEKP